MGASLCFVTYLQDCTESLCVPLHTQVSHSHMHKLRNSVWEDSVSPYQEVRDILEFTTMM